MKYDPLTPPDPREWLDLDEMERIIIVEEYHNRKKIDLPNAQLHATFHVIVENQVAMGVLAVINALKRLQNEGLDRHQAIHAIGTVLADNIFAVLQGGMGADAESESEYFKKLDKLTAESFLKMQG